MKRNLFVAAAAIVVLIGAAFGAVSWLTRGEPSPPPPDPAPLAAAPPVDLSASTTVVAPMAGASVAAPAPVDVPLPPPPRGSWEAVAPTLKPAHLGALGREIVGGLDEFAGRMTRCTEIDAQARHGREAVAGLAGADEGGAPSLMLELETLDGQVRIVDAPVENRGRADDGYFACAQRMLRGQMLEAPSAKPGQRIRLLYPLP